jgi:hypothetical protein
MLLGEGSSRNAAKVPPLKPQAQGLLRFGPEVCR